MLAWPLGPVMFQELIRCQRMRLHPRLKTTHARRLRMCDMFADN